MKKFKHVMLLLSIILMLFASVSCAQDFSKYADQPLEITFMETSDVHGAIFPYNFITGKELDSSMAQLASLVANYRKQGKELVLFDNGDSLQGQPPVYFSNFERTDKPHIWAEVLNYLKYDAITIGNHDIEAGHPVYDKLVKEVKAPMICANINKAGTDEPYFKPYAIIKRQGLKIAVLGMVEPKITEQLPQAFWSGMDVLDMVQTAKRWVPIIQKTEKPDILIGLFHAGVDYTYNGQTADTPSNESASQLIAEQVPGFDIIFVGHDHQGWEGKGYNPVTKTKDVDVKDPSGKIVPIFGTTDAARTVAKVTMTLTWNKEKKAWHKTIKGSLIPIKDSLPDAEFLAFFNPYKEEVIKWVSQPIGKMVGSINSADALFGSSSFVDLIHRIQLELCNDPAMGLKPAEISIAAPLDMSARLPTTKDGNVLVRDMFSLYKYENFLYTMNLTGSQIKQFMEYSYGSQFATMTSANDHLISFVKDKDGQLIFNSRYNSYDTTTRAYNYDSVAGIIYTVDVSKPAGDRVSIISMENGRAFDMNAIYSVAINSYRASGGGGHLTKGVGLPAKDLQTLKLVTSSTTKDLRYYMLKWFEKQVGPIEVKAKNNWKVIPEDWAKAGKALDYPLLYPEKRN